MELERKIRERSSGRLGKFIVKMAGGATPSVQEEEKYYTEEANGIPFIRVQNLTPTNELVLNDLKFINQETHKNYLKRSQVFEDDLLVKITGVGRMAVSSVAPPGFEGNTNQHLVVIKTKNREVSETIATFLNTDIGERLASRRSTGGTRPALDFSALRSIPIVYLPETVEIIKKATAAKRALEAESARLLGEVDRYLLEVLGIELPESNGRKTFFRKSTQLTGKRFDPLFHQSDVYGLLAKTPFEVVRLGSVCQYLITGFAAGKQDQSYEPAIIQIRPTNFYEPKRTLIFDRNVYIKEEELAKRPGDILKKGEVLFNNTNSQEMVGKTVLFDLDGTFFCSNHITRIQPLENRLDSEYLWALLNFYQRQRIFYRICTNWNNQSGVNADALSAVRIPLPPISIQKSIASKIQELAQTSAQLDSEAKAIIEAAKIEVEKIILGTL